eukprot:TRINITY_DN2873_c0_g1_i1.p1 TRINITY_DN2873_c0_g1~~TRINITY_DN2873_c0_g1_i1.p1  ORF type:complete len:380 (+),score=108.21 TRINITY_DN2873_c0_g1_i1:66-1205(+)
MEQADENVQLGKLVENLLSADYMKGFATWEQTVRENDGTVTYADLSTFAKVVELAGDGEIFKVAMKKYKEHPDCRLNYDVSRETVSLQKPKEVWATPVHESTPDDEIVEFFQKKGYAIVNLKRLSGKRSRVVQFTLRPSDAKKLLESGGIDLEEPEGCELSQRFVPKKLKLMEPQNDKQPAEEEDDKKVYLKPDTIFKVTGEAVQDLEGIDPLKQFISMKYIPYTKQIIHCALLTAKSKQNPSETTKQAFFYLTSAELAERVRFNFASNPIDMAGKRFAIEPVNETEIGPKGVDFIKCVTDRLADRAAYGEKKFKNWAEKKNANVESSGDNKGKGKGKGKGGKNRGKDGRKGGQKGEKGGAVKRKFEAINEDHSDLNFA